MYMSFQDHVIKRNGEKEILSFDKILKRVIVLGEDCNSENELNINYTSLVIKIIDRLYDGIPTGKIDELTAQQCASLITTHPDYNKLASRILVSNHHKNTDENYLNVVSKLYNFKDIHGKNSPLVSKELFDLVVKNKDEIQSFFDFDRDYLVDYFGFKTLERAYLQRMGTNIVERPQHMWMRVSLAIHKDDLVKVKQTYDLMSQKFFTHATPTLFNAGTPRQQMSSCYLLAMKDDSIDGIYETLTDCASISKWAGGIGLHIHNVRASGSHIRGTNGTSNGIVPMLRVFNNTARYVDQCVLPETIIYTTNGPMEIQHCTTENNVFTTAGYEKIQNVLEHSYSGEILHIKSIHSFKDLSITPEHPVYCLKNQKKGVNYSTIKNRIAKEIIKPEWIDAKDLTLEDMLIFTKPKYEKDVISISEDDCYMYGLLLGDGSMNNASTSCYISLHSTNKLNNLTFVKNYLTDNCIQYFINTENNTSRIRWNKSMNLPFRYGTLYDENKEKVIHTSWLNLPIKKIKYIVKGLIDSDGCVADEVVFDTTSLKLVEGLRYLLLRLGIPTGGYIRDRRGEKHISKYGDEIENKKISYCLRIPKTESIANLLLIEKGTFHKFFEHDNLIYTRISNIEKGNYEGTLYDLQLEKTHNYMIHNGVIHNGGGKRNGSFAIYLEPWHGDIREFLDMKKTHGDEEQRARDLFYALWIPDLFMKRVSKGAKWTLMCPDKCPGLSDVYGAEFEALYTKYENEGRGEVVQARDIWFKILDSQIETGTPYMLYKDACNKKSNQKNLGTIKSSNLCCEIIEFSDPEETAVCNLASIGLPKFVKSVHVEYDNLIIYSKPNCNYCKMAKNLISKTITTNVAEIIVDDENRDAFKSKFSSEFGKDVKTLPQIIIDGKYIGGYVELLEIHRATFDYEKLHDVVKIVTENLNKVIDINYYPTPKTEKSNSKHRPIGLGVQGLADVFMLMDLPFECDESKKINRLIFETIYHAAVESSMELSLKNGTYSSFEGSPASQGLLSFDMWEKKTLSGRYNWEDLKEKVKKNGLRNSLLIAPMPTASTSQILGNNECFEPYTSNIYLRRTVAGEFVMVNKHLLKELVQLDLWSDDIKNKIIADNGSVQNIPDLPKCIKEKYKIVWEIPMKNIITMCADRAPFVDQSMSMNLWMENPTYKTLTAMHFFSFEQGLKTGLYYLRTKAKAAPQKFTIDPDAKPEDDQDCLMCGA
jgi:ribonucleoside-diphosphate reductase alpha chain